MPKDQSTNFVLCLSVGVALGTSLGTAFGAAFDNVVLGVAIGPGIGIALGFAAYLLLQANRCKADTSPHPSHCPHCGYASKDLPTDTCPECGNSLSTPPPSDPFDF